MNLILSKKILFLFSIIILSSVFLFTMPLFAKGNDVDIYFFYGDGCPHCEKEEVFLEKLKKEIPKIKIHSFEVWNNMDNARFLLSLGKKLNIDISSVPLLIVGNKVFPGFYTDETTGAKIKNTINYYLNNGCTDIVSQAIENQSSEYQEVCAEKEDKDMIALPILGEINIKDFSLPAMTILIAALDGFNPCAMWVLMFLISLLLGMQNRKKMWILGSAFIFASGVVYFLFLSAWLNLFLFLGFVFWIRILIGFVALGSGGYHLKEYWSNRSGVCKITGSEKRKIVFEKLRNIIVMKKFWLALLGIMALAVAVNLVELVCSAGLPAIYTQVLAMSDLARWQYYGYLILYIFIFMLDDMLVFVIAMATLRMKAISSKYSRWSNLIGGIIMVIIGILLVFKPGWIMF